MIDTEWIDELVYQRIEALLNEKIFFDECGKEMYIQALKQSEKVLERLTEEDWDTIDKFRSLEMIQHSRECSYLYVCGIQDGIRAMKYINRL